MHLISFLVALFLATPSLAAWDPVVAHDTLLEQATGLFAHAGGTGGSGGSVVYVTSLADTDTGSLRALAGAGNSIVLFEDGVDGTIDVGSPLVIGSNTTIWGVHRDGTGADVYLNPTNDSAVLQVTGTTSNVILANLKGDAQGSANDSAPDLVQVRAGADRVWVYHLSGFGCNPGCNSAMDGFVDANEATNVTVSWSYVEWWAQIHLIRSGATATIDHNYYYQSGGRQPKSDGVHPTTSAPTKVHFYNNWAQNWISSTASKADAGGELRADKNVYDASGSCCNIAISETYGGKWDGTGNHYTNGAHAEPHPPTSTVFTPAYTNPMDTVTTAIQAQKLRDELAAATGWLLDPIRQCNDGIDNDGDSELDFPDDPGCTDVLDASEQASFCGDTILEATNGEQCDDGNTVTEACDYGLMSCLVCGAACQELPGATSFCGDTILDATNGEQCDDGNTVTEACSYGLMSCLVCDAACQEVPGATFFCGDTTLDGANGEGCEDGNTVTEACSYGSMSCLVCSSACQEVPGATSFCGDSLLDATNGEQCDDGNTTAGDGCEPSCQISVACSDGVDNDGDSELDFPDDPGCTDALDFSERAAGVAELPCDNVTDDDADGFADFFDGNGDGISDPPGDPGCASPGNLKEAPKCQDGIDNDQVPGIDFDGGASIHGAPVDVPDPQCTVPSRDAEVGGRLGCGLGFELALLLPLVQGLRSHRRFRFS
jgi:cysteine-rich repeat protein